MFGLTPIDEEERILEDRIVYEAREACSAKLAAMLTAAARKLDCLRGRFVHPDESEAATREGEGLVDAVIESLISDLPFDFGKVVGNCEDSELLPNEEYVVDRVRQLVLSELRSLL